jgi:hypothetical protein
MDKKIQSLLDHYDTAINELAAAAREMLLRNIPAAKEEADLPANMITYGFGPAYSDMVCTLILSKKGVKIGFYKGGELPDPHSLLTGSGKVHKHVVVTHKKEIAARALHDLVKAAFAAYLQRKKK